MSTNPPKPPGLQPEKPPPDEFMGRGGKRKKPGKDRPAKTQVEEQIDAALATSALHTQKQQQKKKRFKYAIIAGVIALLSYGIYYGLKPFEGGMAYGVCRVFLENYVRFPGFLRLSTVEEFENSVRIWYTQVDSFGEYRMEPIQCYYKQDEERGTLLDRVLVNRREVDPKLVENFNRSIPAVVNMELDLVLPSPLPDSLEDLQFETDKFRKPVI